MKRMVATKILLIGAMVALGVLAAAPVFADSSDSSQQLYVRRFKDVLHVAIMRGAPGTDMQQEVLAKLLASTPDAGLNEEFELQAFWPLNSNSDTEELIWVERYPSLREWTENEISAQRSPKWITNQVKLMRSGVLESFYSEMVVEDTLDEAHRLTGKPGAPPIAVHWMQLRSETILPNLTELPQHVRKLTRLLSSAGFDDAVVKFYGTATSAGSDRENAFIWIEYPTLERMAKALDFMVTNAQARRWRKELVTLTDIQKQWYLLQAK